MPPVSAPSSNFGVSASMPQIDLGNISPVAQKVRLEPGRTSLPQVKLGAKSTMGGTAVKSAKPLAPMLRSCPPSTGRMPSAYVVSNLQPPTRINVDDIPPALQQILNKNPGWSPVLGGKLEVRYSQTESAKAGVPVFELRGAKSTVKLKANTWVDAAKEAVRLSAAGALAPRTEKLGASLSTPSSG
jgi:hypothetical protein